jgi:UDP-glucose 4-epimerase
MSEIRKNKILVTGGSGAVGTNLVNKLLKKECEVTVLDNFSQSKKKNLSQHKNLKIIKGDITKSDTVKKIFTERFEYVFHLAARFANELSVEDPSTDLDVNVKGTLNLLVNSAKQNPIKFVYTSSSSIYGPQIGSMKEDLLPNPTTPYAASKLSAEHYCNTISSLYGLDVTILRLSNSYGPYDLPGRYRNVIPNFMNNALRNKDIIITGTGNETRDFTYVDDTVSGIILATQSSKSKNQLFNLGTGKETKIKDIVNKILELSNSKSKIIFKKRREFDHIKNRKMDIKKAKNTFKYNPSVSINDGLGKTFEWFVNNYKEF